MQFVIPFNDQVVNDMVGRTMVLSENHRNEAMFKAFLTTQVKAGGDTDRGHFEVSDGVLRLMDKQGLFCEFAGLETRNGGVYAVGTAAQTISRHGFDRIVMHEREVLDVADFGICISSHITYAKTTLPLLLDSIRKAKFDMTRVVAVVGGYAGDKTEEMEGAKVIYQEKDGKGFGGLIGATGTLSYWLLLHDTSEAERSFVDSVRDIDIGLNQDVVRLRADKDDWTGFYRWDFLNRIQDEIYIRPGSAGALIRQNARVVTVVFGKAVEAGLKDVYGTGNKRMIERLPVGIRKFRGVISRRTP